ncbi:MAG: hypothetical protein CMI79_01540 [Candidatus Pelagibacter sp.]|nr:hypothetical protein [Candidatus Pelagibacter sp.]|tara:strand:+ start:8123 stop:8992 length:870 start_codon:yes stop_codon:yes gene_type:complete
MQSKKIVLATTTRNPGKRFNASIKKALKIGEKFKSYHIIIVESDSTKRLSKFFKSYKNNKNITVIRLGNLSTKLKYGHLRTERISFSRNQYIDLLKNEKKLEKFDYLIAFDSDGVSSLISYKIIKDALELKIDWSAQFPNQLIYYYDIYALRSKNWVEENYKIQRDKFLSKGINPKKAILKSLSEKIIHINVNSKLIPVESAFGGLGIYKINRIKKARYVGSIDEKSVCEHIIFNKTISDEYPGTLFINPKLISGFGFPEHTFIPKILIKIIPSFIFDKLYIYYKLKQK